MGSRSRRRHGESTDLKGILTPKATEKLAGRGGGG